MFFFSCALVCIFAVHELNSVSVLHFRGKFIVWETYVQEIGITRQRKRVFPTQTGESWLWTYEIPIDVWRCPVEHRLLVENVCHFNKIHAK